MKVFCIGTWKTATTSVGQALNFLYKGKHQAYSFENQNLYLNNNFKELANISKNIQTFDDSPWNCIEVWTKLEKLYPNSKFILSIRDEEEWFNSMKSWYGGDLNTFRRSRFHKKTYDNQLKQFGYNIEKMSVFNDSTKKMWIDWYNKRNTYVKEYFKNTDRLLILNFKDGNLWDKLCTFLNKKIPIINFPNLNKNQDFDKNDEVLYVTLNKNFDKSIKVALPSVDFWINKIKNKEHFHFVKCNHGLYDHLHSSYAKENSIRPIPFPKNSEEAVPILFKRIDKWNKNVKYDIYKKSIDALYTDLRNRENKNLFVGISDSNGFAWIIKRNKTGHASTFNTMCTMIDKNSRPYIHGGIIRQYTVKEEINNLFKEFEKEENNVIIVGPKYCENYKCKIKNFKMVTIPHINALNNFEEIVNSINKKIDKSKHNIILASCAVMSFLLSQRFRNNNQCYHTFIDVGRAFDHYLKDKLNQPWLKVPTERWVKVVDDLRNPKHKLFINKEKL